MSNTFSKGDIVLYHNQKYKVDNVKIRNGIQSIKMHTIRGKSHTVAYSVSPDELIKVSDNK